MRSLVAAFAAAPIAAAASLLLSPSVVDGFSFSVGSPAASTKTASQIPWTLNTEEYGEYNQHRDWGFAYSATPVEACGSYVIENTEGQIPNDLVGSGTFYKIGPGNFERGGQKYEHVLDGDGFATSFEFCEDGTVRYTGKFVETEYYKKEVASNQVQYRNVFGTQRQGGMLTNAFDLTLKNVANTNILKWGGRLYALWEAGRPYELDPTTLETLYGNEDGPLADLGLDAKVRGITIDGGGPIDSILNVGKSFTAHPHVWDENTLVAFKSETNAQTNELTMEFIEYDAHFHPKHSTNYTLKDSPPPHDFSTSENYYSFFENPYGEMDSTQYLLGLKAPTQVMQLALRQPTRLHLVPRDNNKQPIVVELPASYFDIHVVGRSRETADGKLTLYSTGWDLTDERFFPQSRDKAPFLGAWGGPYPDFTGGIVPPSLLYKNVIDLETAQVIQHEEVCPGIVIEFPTQEENNDDESSSNNFVYCPIATEDYTSLPSVGICKINTATSKIETWWAEQGIFTHEAIPVSKSEPYKGSWLLTMLYDARNQRASLAILDSEDITKGPVCRLHLKHHVTYGLHGSFSKNSSSQSGNKE